MTDDLYKSTSKELWAKFYVVSPKKFILLFVGTMGAYSIYWFYQQWDYYRSRTAGKQWPIIRALFPIFFVHTLFSIFDLEHKDKTGKTLENFKLLATFFVLLSIIDYSFNTLSGQGIGSPYTDLNTFVTLPLFGFILYKIQLAVNVICDDSKGESNNTFTFANYFWVILILGLTIWVAYYSMNS